MTKIYTKTGDQGETSLFSGHRVSKNDPTIDALGTVDEANCAIGQAIAFLPPGAPFEEIRKQLVTIQNTLFDLGASLATPRTRAPEQKLKKTRFGNEGVVQLEEWIDALDNLLPQLRTFILPGGHPAGAQLHNARVITRRAERLIVPIHQHSDVSESVLTYINRLSDYLFVAARTVNHLAHIPEYQWQSV